MSLVFGIRHDEKPTDEPGWLQRGLFAIHVVAYAVVPFFIGRPLEPILFVQGCILAALLIWISCIDFARFEIPDTASALLAVTGLMSLLILPAEVRLSHLIAGLSFSFLFYAVGMGFRVLRHQDGLGFGDVKLAVGIGFWVGPIGVVSVLLGASLAALGTLVVASLIRGKGLQEMQNVGIAFGPFLCLFTWVVWLRGLG